MKTGVLLIILLVAGGTASAADGAYWYFITERDGIFKYSRILQCSQPIQESSLIRGEFTGNDAVGPFKSYGDADMARSRDVDLATKTKKKILLGESMCL